MTFPSFLRENTILENSSTVAGIDEVGRGCIAGPVVAGIVMITSLQESPIIGVRDSKKLSEKKRELLSDQILINHPNSAIGFASNLEVDELGIINATKLAMLRAYWNLPTKPRILLIDGKKTTKPLTKNTFQYIKGDDRAYSIAAASIIAKVFRDNLVSKYDEILSGYDFTSHKGYGTKKHYEALKHYGVTKYHRKSFLKNFTF